jgi:hypothetical protein
MNEVVQETYPTQISIADLFPTQMTVGMREVDIKRMRWRNRSIENRTHYLNTHPVPVVVGPDKRHYMIDCHHLILALSAEGIVAVPVSIVRNSAGLTFEAFWSMLDNRYWTHPFDDTGCRCPFENMPTSIEDLIDDPFRSLAGALRRMGGYAKSKTPFSEFRWADYLRDRIAPGLVERDFGLALAIAMNLAQSNEAAELPGWHSSDLPLSFFTMASLESGPAGRGRTDEAGSGFRRSRSLRFGGSTRLVRRGAIWPASTASRKPRFNWKAKYGGLDVSEARRLRQLEDENGKLKELVADLSLGNVRNFM